MNFCDHGDTWSLNINTINGELPEMVSTWPDCGWEGWLGELSWKSSRKAPKDSIHQGRETGGVYSCKGKTVCQVAAAPYGLWRVVGSRKGMLNDPPPLSAQHCLASGLMGK